MYILEFDGLFQEVERDEGEGLQAGFMSYGWLIYKNGKVIARGFGVFAHARHAASNLAEYLALIDGLQALLDLGIHSEKVEIRGDAKCVIDQMKGHVHVSSIPTKQLYQNAIELTQQISRIKWKWIPRTFNREADGLSKQAIQYLHRGRSYASVLARLKSKIRQRSLRLIPVIDLRIFQLDTVSNILSI